MISVTDQFCGAGGSSSGAIAVPGVEVVFALNHWRRAIETHNTNHPNVRHDCVDISQVDPRRYETTDILLTSPECTNHTTAKNHRLAAAKLTPWDAEREAERSRATMWDVPRFAEYHDYKAVVVENVVEARTWRMFDAWLQAMDALEYDHDIVYLNSMFCPPTPQSRDRMYTVFWKRGQRRPALTFRPIAWCENCREKVEAVQKFKSDFHRVKARADALVQAGKRTTGLRRWGLYRQQYIYACPRCAAIVEPTAFPAYTAIDWTLPSQRIGDRTRPLAEKTLARIRRGIEKYGRTPVLVPLSYPGADRAGHSVDGVFPAQTARASVGLAHSFLAQLAGHAYEREGSTCRSRSIEDPMRTQTTTASEGLVLVPLVGANRAHGVPRPVDQPMQSQCTATHLYVLGMPFVAELRGGGSNERPVDDPLSTVTAAGNHHMLVHPDAVVVSNYTPGRAWRASEEPLGAVTGIDHHGLLEWPAFIDTYNGQANPRHVAEPLTTATTKDRHALVEHPGELPEVEDCYYRMLEPHEIQAAMAFAPDYIVTGNKREQVKQLGNAVTPPVMTMIVERLVESLS
jgi:DNA (cytosine-5)-methyltransferase 1